MDFVIEMNGKAVPIEVKSGKRRKCDISSHLYVLSVERTEAWTDDRRTGYCRFVE